MSKSSIEIFKSVLLHPLRFCRENDNWNGSGDLLRFGFLMLSLSVGLQLLRLLTTAFVRRVDIFIGLYSIFLFYIVLPLALFAGLAVALHISLWLFGEQDIYKTAGALELSSVVLVLWGAAYLVAVRASIGPVFFLFAPFLAVFWSFLIFQSLRYAHEIDAEKTVLVTGLPFAVAVITVLLEPEVLSLLDIAYDFAGRIPGYLGYEG